MLDILKFITGSIIGALLLLQIPQNAKPEKVIIEEYPTIWVEPSLDQKAGWCENNKQCQSMAEAIVYEARGEPEEGKYAVAHVIQNRVEAERWPDTVRQVIHQYKQFSYLRDKHRQKTPTRKDWTIAYGVAYDVLNDLVVSPVADATHYHTTKVRPSWARELEVVAKIDNHIFYR